MSCTNYGLEPAFKCELVVKYKNSAVPQVVIKTSTNTWKSAAVSQAYKGDMFEGEAFDFALPTD